MYLARWIELVGEALETSPNAVQELRLLQRHSSIIRGNHDLNELLVPIVDVSFKGTFFGPKPGILDNVFLLDLRDPIYRPHPQRYSKHLVFRLRHH